MSRRWLARAEDAWARLGPRSRRVLVCLLWIVGTVPVLSRQVIGRPLADLGVFLAGTTALLQGAPVYDTVAFEYPPYAFLWFLVPYAASTDLEDFRIVFGFEIWLVDAAMKGGLLWLGLRTRSGLRALVPFLAYAVGGAALGHILLQRFDLVVAALTGIAVLAAAANRPLAAGGCLALAVGSKIYPVLFVPVLGVLHWQRDRRQLLRFAGGFALGLLPLVIAGFWIPWWRFASYHAARGLQAESLLASFVWALHFAGVPAQWEFIPQFKSSEVTGPTAAALVGPGRLFWVVATCGSTAVAIRAAWHLGARRDRNLPPTVGASLLLLSATAFVATNTVFSPQFHLWLLPLAALVLVPSRAGDGHSAPFSLPPAVVRGAWCLVIATVIVPVFFPHREYSTGLGAFRTVALLCRNGLMVYAGLSLFVGVRAMGHADRPRSPANGGG